MSKGMDYGMECGCAVTVSEDTAAIVYCEKHRARKHRASKKLSVPAESLVEFTQAADKLVNDIGSSMDLVAKAGRKLIDAIKEQ